MINSWFTIIVPIGGFGGATTLHQPLTLGDAYYMTTHIMHDASQSAVQLFYVLFLTQQTLGQFISCIVIT